MKRKKNVELEKEEEEKSPRDKIIGANVRKYDLDGVYVPDECDIGACLYFKGISLTNLNRIDEALKCFLEVLDNKWIIKKKSKVFKKFHIQTYYDRIALSRYICIFFICMLTLLLIPLPGLHFCVGLDLVKPSLLFF
jgi:hypothetical protein